MGSWYLYYIYSFIYSIFLGGHSPDITYEASSYSGAYSVLGRLSNRNTSSNFDPLSSTVRFTEFATTLVATSSGNACSRRSNAELSASISNCRFAGDVFPLPFLPSLIRLTALSAFSHFVIRVSFTSAVLHRFLNSLLWWFENLERGTWGKPIGAKPGGSRHGEGGGENTQLKIRF